MSTKRDHLHRNRHLPTIDFPRDMLVFGGVSKRKQKNLWSSDFFFCGGGGCSYKQNHQNCLGKGEGGLVTLVNNLWKQLCSFKVFDKKSFRKYVQTNQDPTPLHFRVRARVPFFSFNFLRSTWMKMFSQERVRPLNNTNKAWLVGLWVI